jgi:nitroreductase|tara:strand:- start:196 stop:792 length:597 start_codon:yes stop_codon:yes gene_type:complete
MILDLIKNRYTTKHWLDKPIKNKKIENILEAAYLSPKKSGEELFLIHVLQDSKKSQDLRSWMYNSTVKGGIYQGQFHSPLILTFSVENNNRIAKMNLGVCAAFALLCAEDMGLNTSLTCCHDRNILAKKLNLSNSYQTDLCLCIGYAKKDNKIIEEIPSSYYRIVQLGRDLKNIDPSYKKEHPKRLNYKNKTDFIQYV